MNRKEFILFENEHPTCSELGNPVYIYALIDPITEEIRYIGKSINPVGRLTNHMNDRSNCHRSNWLQSLKSNGMLPRMVILERIEGDIPWQISEMFWIAYGRRMGCPLTNGTSGGDGVVGLSIESRKRMASTWIGRKHKPDTIDKLRTAGKLRAHSEETRGKMSEAHKGRSITWSDKVAASLRKLSDDDVSTILLRMDYGENTGKLAEEYGVHRTTISKIRTGKYYVK